MSNELLFACLVLLPMAFGLLALLAPGWRSRSAVVVAGAAATLTAGVFTATQGPFILSLGAWGSDAALALELLVIGAIIAIAIRIRSAAILGLGLVQMALAIVGEHTALHPAVPGPDFILDGVSLVLVLIVTIVGSLIVLYAIGYMKRHEEHAPPTAAGPGRFFFFMIAFLGMMNGLVLANDLRWLSIFWEATTLCSFALIGHDGTPEARRNARTALFINAFGGAAMILAGTLAASSGAGESLTGILSAKALVPAALLCLAAFTKSAQMPFQKWLLGAMVAPTPVSALLHAATMVKAGCYLVIRLAPAFTGERLMVVVSLAGAFTFALTSALAVGQSNAKKVLAYSTIGALGLIIACASLNTPAARMAALMLLCFHAVSKGLLFLCVGTIEQKIGSRDIEDMGVIMFEMPLTTTIALLGMVSMVVPPFGMLVGKWMAIEAAIGAPYILVPLVLGSALTVLFWAKWLGRIQTVSYHAEFKRERLPASMLGAQYTLAVGVIATAVLAVPALGSAPELAAWPIFGAAGLALLASLVAWRRFKPEHVRLPYLGGENVVTDNRTWRFRGLKDEPDTAWAATLYFGSIFEESRLTFWANLGALLIVLSMFGVLRIL